MSSGRHVVTEMWWTPDALRQLSAEQRAEAVDRLAEAVEAHIVSRTSPDELARRRATRWLRANGLAAVVQR